MADPPLAPLVNICGRAAAVVPSRSTHAPPSQIVTSVFLGCFAFGLIFTVGSFLLGALGGSHVHLPGFHLDGGSHQGGGGHHATATGVYVSVFNASTASAFLTWFGGAGYLLSRYSEFTAVVTTLFATMVGLFGGGIVFVALSKFPPATPHRNASRRLSGRRHRRPDHEHDSPWRHRRDRLHAWWYATDRGSTRPQR